MKLKKWTALALSAALATCMLTGCPWDEDDAASSDLPASSSRPSHDGGSDEDDSGSTGGSTGGNTGDGTEEGNPDSGEEEKPDPEPVEYTFDISFSIPDGEPAPTRGYIQILDSDDGGVKTVTISENRATYTANLLPNQEHTCLFWADNATGEDAPDNLTAVSYTAGTAAYADSFTVTPKDSTNITQTVTLEPVTTKVTIQCTGGETIDKLTVTLNFAESFNVQSMKASSGVQEGRNIASFSSGDGNLLWESSAWKTQTTWLVQALSRLSRADDGEYTGTFYALLPSDLTDEQKTVTIVYNDGTSEREYKETLTMNGTSASVQIDLTDKNKNEGTLIEN